MNAEQVTCQAGIDKVQFARLHNLLAKVAVPGREPMHDVTGFQDRNPCFCRVVRNTAVGGQGRKIQYLPAASGTQAHEALKRVEILRDFAVYTESLRGAEHGVFHLEFRRTARFDPLQEEVIEALARNLLRHFLKIRGIDLAWQQKINSADLKPLGIKIFYIFEYIEALSS